MTPHETFLRAICTVLESDKLACKPKLLAIKQLVDRALEAPEIELQTEPKIKVRRGRTKRNPT